MDNLIQQNIPNLNQNLSNTKSRIQQLIPYIFCFFIFSFLGWLLETLFCAAQGSFEKRGFLYATICPIYGTGALLLTTYLDRSKIKNNYLKLFILFTIVFSIFEYFVGFVLDALFAEKWWDYTDNFGNLNGRITLLNSFLWGVITVAFTRFIYPLIQKFKDIILTKVPILAQLIIASILVIGILIDFIFSCIKYLK